MQSIITLTIQTRNLVTLAVKDLTPEQWFLIPNHFNNNIAWNVGHIVATQQTLFYRLCGVKPYTDKVFGAMFNRGTSPADWESHPDPAELLAMLSSTADALQADFDKGIFEKFRPFTTDIGLSINTIAESAAFNLYHEGLHLGAIQSIKNLI